MSASVVYSVTEKQIELLREIADAPGNFIAGGDGTAAVSRLCEKGLAERFGDYARATALGFQLLAHLEGLADQAGASDA